MKPNLLQIHEAVSDALEYFEDRQDVIDGPDGTHLPNEEMGMVNKLTEALVDLTKLIQAAT